MRMGPWVVSKATVMGKVKYCLTHDLKKGVRYFKSFEECKGFVNEHSELF